VFPALAGGPVALLRDDTKLVLYVGGFTKPDLQLYSAAGALLLASPAELLRPHAHAGAPGV
jgi:hypothetical protein